MIGIDTAPPQNFLKKEASCILYLFLAIWKKLFDIYFLKQLCLCASSKHKFYLLRFSASEGGEQLLLVGLTYRRSKNIIRVPCTLVLIFDRPFFEASKNRFMQVS